MDRPLMRQGCTILMAEVSLAPTDPLIFTLSERQITLHA